MSTSLPPDAYPAEVVAWWESLTEREQDIHALRAAELVGGLRTLFFKVAEKPELWAREAFKVKDVAWREPPEQEP